MIIAKKNLKTALHEGKGFLDKSIQIEIKKCCDSSLKALKKDLKKVDSKLDEVIKSDEELNRLFSIITSVEGIGPVTAREIIMTTNEFKTFTNPKSTLVTLEWCLFPIAQEAASGEETKYLM